MQLLLAEINRIREEAKAEKRAHRLQIERLEAELRMARYSSEQMEDTEQGENVEMRDSKKRGRSRSLDSRQESASSTTIGANMLNLLTGYRAVDTYT